jgi:competence protein ComEC
MALTTPAVPVNLFRWAVLPMVVAIAAQLQQPALWRLGVYAWMLAAGVAGIVLCYRAVSRAGASRARWALRFASLISGSLLGFGLAGVHGQLATRGGLDPALEGKDVVITGHVAQLPVQAGEALRFVFEADMRPRGMPERVQLSWYGMPDPAALVPGSRWQLTVRLRAPHGLMNLHGFDYELYLLERGIQAAGYVRSSSTNVRERANTPYRYWLTELRHTLKQRIDVALGDAPYKGVVQALAMGDQSAIDRDEWRVFRDTGVGHLMSISGLHVTMFAWLAALAAGGLWRRSSTLMLWLPAPTAARWIGFAVAASYALTAGWGVPAQRTVWMLLVATLAMHGGLRFAWVDVLLAALAVVLVFDPWAVLQPGYWLSFAAVAFLFWGAQREAATLHQADHTQAIARWLGMWQAIKAAARVQMVATLSLVPLTVLFFQQVSLVSPLANALAIPVVSLLVTPTAVLALLLPAPVSTVLWHAAHEALAVMHLFLEWLAAWPAATVSLAAPAPLAFVLALLACAVLLAPAIGALRWMGVPMLLPLWLVQPGLPPAGEMQVHFIDVGQGTAVLVRTARYAMLYDTGPSYASGSDAAERAVVPMLRALGVRKLDVLVISHRDSDHAGGAATVLGALQADRVVTSMTADELPLAKSIERCAAGLRWQWDGVRIEVLHPSRDDYELGIKPNGLSCVLKVTAASGPSMLLAGDIEQAQEWRLLATDEKALAATVLLAPHHGSKTSSSAPFLQAVQARAAVVQVSYRSRYGHPHPEVLARYQVAGVAVMRTDCDGALFWRSDAPEVWVKAREERWQYWRHTCLQSAKNAETADLQESD